MPRCSLFVALAAGRITPGGLIGLLGWCEPIVDTGSSSVRGITDRLAGLVERAANPETEIANALLRLPHRPINFGARALHHAWLPSFLTTRGGDRAQEPDCVRPAASIHLREVRGRLQVGSQSPHQAHEESRIVKRLCAESTRHIMREAISASRMWQENPDWKSQWIQVRPPNMKLPSF